MSLGQRWTLGRSVSYGHASTVFMGRLLHTVGAECAGLHKHVANRGMAYRRSCAACGKAWHDGYTLRSNLHVAVTAPETVYLCPKCRGGGGLIILPGRITL